MKIKFRALCLAALVVVLAFASVASALPRYIVTDEPGNAAILTLNSDNTFTSNDMSIAGSLNDHMLYSLADYKYILAVANGSLGVFTANGTSDPKWTKATATDIEIPTAAAADTNGNIGLVYVPTSKTGKTMKSITSSDTFLKVAFDDDGKLSTTRIPLVGPITGHQIDAKTLMMAAWDNFFVVISNDDTGIGTDGQTIASAGAGSYDLQMIEFPFSVTASTLPAALVHSTDVGTTFDFDGTNPVTVSSDRVYLSVASGDWAYLSTGYGLYTFKKPSYSLNEQQGLKITRVLLDHLLGLQIDKNTQPIAVISRDTDNDGDANNVTLNLVRFDAPKSDGTFQSTNFRTKSISDDIRIAGNGSTILPVGNISIAYDNDSDYVTVINASETAGVYGRLVVYQPSGNTWAVVASCDLEPTAVAAQIASTSSSGGDDTPSTKATVAAVSATDAAALADAKTGLGMSDTDTFAGSTVNTSATKDSTVESTIKEKLENDTTSASVSALATVTPDADGFVVLSGTAFEGKDPSKTFFYFVDSNGALIDGTLLTSTGAKASTSDSVYLGSSKALTSGTTYTVYTATTSTKSSGDDDSGDTGSSSSGCDAGFGLMSLAALLAVTTLSKRR